MVVLALPPADHLLIERRDRGQFVPSWRRRKPPCRDPGLRPSCVSQRRSSNANSLQSQNSAGFPGICATFKGIICADISEIAVGTLITERPPHRAERAPFGHSAPTSGI